MKHILIILSIFFISSPLFGQSKDDCYLFVGGSFGEDEPILDQIVRPLIASFVSPLKRTPVSGLSQCELDSSCYYEVLLHMIEETLNLSISGQSTPTPLNGIAKSNRSFPENVKHSTLRVLHNELNESKKKLICRRYFKILVDECPLTLKGTKVFRNLEINNKEENSWGKLLNYKIKKNLITVIFQCKRQNSNPKIMMVYFDQELIPYKQRTLSSYCVKGNIVSIDFDTPKKGYHLFSIKLLD